MTVTREAVQDWLDRYVDAWRTYDPKAIGELFAENASYRYHPYDSEAVTGREAIVRAWTEPSGDASSRDDPDTWDAHYGPYAVDGDRAVAVGRSRYYTDTSRSTVREVYDNVYLLEFGQDRRCRSFTEFYVQRPKDR